MAAKASGKKVGWFAVDKDGLSQLLTGRGPGFIIYELVSNSFDELTKEILVEIQFDAASRARAQQLGRKSGVWIRVQDDSPEGFQDLTHAYTLFASSMKKGDPEKRGRFNLGEKFVLALCLEAVLETTKGTLHFWPDGTRSERVGKRSVGSEFRALIEGGEAEYQALLAAAQAILPPLEKRLVVNGREIKRPGLVKEFAALLPSVKADARGILHPTERRTQVQLFLPEADQPAMIYELGIPVVETQDTYHVNVDQKVPLNMNRDNVTPAFLRAVRTAVLNQTSHLLPKEEIAEDWVDMALSNPKVSDEAVRNVLHGRFGEKLVVASPTDREANHRAVAEGYQVLYGGHLSKPQWENVKRAEVAPNATELFGTPALETSMDGEDVSVPIQEWGPSIQAAVELTVRLARKLMGVELHVAVVRSQQGFQAAYGRLSDQQASFTYNFRALGRKWFDRAQTEPGALIDLILHEFGHQYSGNHLSDEYYHALTRLAGQAVVLALREPQSFELKRASPLEEAAG